MIKLATSLLKQLSQKFRKYGVLGVTFFLMSCQSNFFLNKDSKNIPEKNPQRESVTIDSANTNVDSTITNIGSEPILDGIKPDLELKQNQKKSDDLLSQLRNSFQLVYKNNGRIDAEKKWISKHPKYMTRVLSRSQLYMPYIVTELHRRKMPLELALLPIVESAYDPFAYSHGRAAGLWQMIPGTAKRFGIKQNWWYDGRRDIIDSTRAALDYLEYLYKFNNNNWLNAIASYNAGEGNVRKAIRRNKKLNKPTDYWSLELNKETSMYVPRLLALVEVIANPEKYNLALPKIENKQQFKIVNIGSQFDLALAAELAGVRVDTIYQYNPGYNHWSTDPSGPHNLVIPINIADNFSNALKTIPMSERVRWRRHKIKSGEAISQIAEKYNTTISAIKASNNLKNNTIKTDRYLVIPVATKPLSAYSKSANQRLKKIQNRVRSGNKIEHIVKNGESFWTISRQYKVTIRQLASWNGMAPKDTLMVGKKLVVWGNDLVNSRASPKKALGNTIRKLQYTVRNGDSLYLIAQRFKIDIDQIVRWNKINKNKFLQPGQKLTVYVDVASQSS
tara:strand:- start:588 stop:2273 length:1686 start_codon:yes stop_codon:yes gene_type:complete